MKKREKNEEKTYKSGEVMSMLEQINDGVAVIGEQHKTIVGRLGGIDNRLDKMQGDIDVMKNDIDVMKNDIDVIKSDVSDIKYDLKQKVGYEEFEKMEKRVVKLEKLVFAKLT